MATYNTLLKKRNATNNGWDSMLPVTTADNVLVDEFGGTVASQLADIVTEKGDLTTLETTEKTNLVGAINEVFTNGNNVKSNTVDALLSVDDSLPIASESTWTDIITQIGNISTGTKWATGTTLSTTSTSSPFTCIDGTSFNSYLVEITELDFIPSLVVLYFKQTTALERCTIFYKTNTTDDLHAYPVKYASFTKGQSTAQPTVHIQGDKPSCQISLNSVKLPVGVNASNFKWIAVEL